MRKILYNVLNFTLFGNIFIALCAPAQAIVTYAFFRLVPSVWLCSFLFFATICMYNCSILFNKPNDFKILQNKRIRWFFAHQKLNAFITLAAGMALIPLFLTLAFVVKIVVFFLAIVSLAYLLPVFKVHKQAFSLRNIRGLKLFVIALVWAVSAVLLPVLQSRTSIPPREIIILLVQQFMLFAAIALAFDVKDMYHDKAHNLNTLPTMYGAKKANLIAVFLLIVCVFILVMFNHKGFGNYFFASLISILVAVWLTFKNQNKNSVYYFYLCLDGILIAQYLLLLLFNWARFGDIIAQ